VNLVTPTEGLLKARLPSDDRQSMTHTPTPAPWMLVGRAPVEHAHELDAHADHPRMSKWPILHAVARRGLPRIIEATVIPAILFFVVVSTVGEGAAMIAVLVWAFGAILRRVVMQQPIPAILVLATLGLTMRTTVGLLSGSTFTYFLQPIATTVVLAIVFLGSVVIGRPVIARLAHDFCPISPEVARRPRVMRLFAGLTILWACVHVLSALTTFGMLVSLPVPLFVAVKTMSSFGLTAAAIVITVVWALRTAHQEELVFASL
jgi:intracellular septation protein A